ncbi:filamentous haemagglutinin family protein [Halochromatium glycolicum]|uniref:Filamentous haemagglutinin FhaB/tRNA nuclease CdiA-like TPS domain-containing protein n=1 Tax=Halochromatium glycolicum TaxID=85075 RepID=A0AAJ0U3F5_9GAMM|nr:filamentous haemagglutinin family protein [Halochromatium glycolicum]MBK1704506.1 hypothetical protein [Halochromatium glycolicum]
MRRCTAVLIALAGAGPSLLAASEPPAGLPRVFPTDHAQFRFDGASRRYLNDNQLRIDQTADRAILHWQSFDIAPGKAVEFRQPSQNSIALNRVLGDGGRSLIDGQLTANGRIFLINQNGILFGNNARVNVHSLIASTLDIEDTVYEDVGFVNAINRPDAGANDYLTSPETFAAFDKRHNADPTAEMGAIECAPGCTIVSGQNGRVMLFAPSVVNRGSISSPEGQIVLAAPDDRVYIAAEDSEFRGLLVEVKTGAEPTADAPYRGVHNFGELIAERGNISLVGMAVNQSGLVRATTSVSLNGSIRLMAQDMSGPDGDLSPSAPRSSVADNAGTLTLGPGSVTEVVPETSGVLAPDAQAQSRSEIRLRGKEVTLRSGSRVIAPGGDVLVQALVNPNRRGTDLGQVRAPAEDGPEILSESGAIVDVSGYDQTQVSVARNFVQVEARGNELADSPLQRDGPIRNQTLTVDIRRGTDFLNIDSAVAAALMRDAGERLSVGGTIRLESTGRIRVAPGAVLDISGGMVTYTGDTVSTSKLISADGRVVDISDADPNVRYRRVLGDLEVNHEKWGIREVFPSLLGSSFERGYVEGKDAGELILSAPDIIFEGDLLAASIAGDYQRYRPALAAGVAAYARPFDQVPLGGRLTFNLLDRRFPDLFIGGLSDEDARNDYPASSIEAVVLSPALFTQSGLSRARLTSTGRIILNESIQLPAYGELELSGAQVLVSADVRIPGGDVAITRQTGFSGSGDFSEEALDLASLGRIGGIIDVSGTWTNDSELIEGASRTGPIVTEGGRIRIGAALDGSDDNRALTGVEIAANASLDVSGGAHLSVDGAFTGGRAGEILLKSGSKDGDLPSRLEILGELRGFGMASGGTLEIATDEILIGTIQGAASAGFGLNGAERFRTVDSEVLTDWERRALAGDDPVWRGLEQWGTADSLSEDQLSAWDLSLAIGEGIARNLLVVDAGIFQRGGFQSFSLRSNRAGLGVLPGTEIRLQAANPVPAAWSVALVPSGDSIAHFAEPALLNDYDRQPVDLSLSSSSTGALNLGSGASIIGDPGARVALTSVASLFIDGTIDAPAGTVEVQQTGAEGSFDAARKVWLGSQARLLAPGAVRVDPASRMGQQVGEVLDAGRVSVRADQGSLIGSEGALINVDAVSAELNVGLGGVGPRVRVGARAGQIELSASESLAYRGRLSGRGVLDEEPGSLTVTLSAETRGRSATALLQTPVFDLGPDIALMQDFRGVLPGPGKPIGDDLQNRAFVPVGQIEPGGFASLRVAVRSSSDGVDDAPGRDPDAEVLPVPDTLDSLPIIEFTGDLTLGLAGSLVLDAAILRSTGDHEVVLEAPHVAIGSSDTRVHLDGSVPDVILDANGVAQQNAGQRLDLLPVAGGSRLRIEADLIELVGELVTQGFGDAGSGTPGVVLSAAADLRMRGVRADRKEVYEGLFRTAGDLSILARRVYPTTLTDFELRVVGAGGTLRIDPRDASIPSAPLSLGGTLQVHADVIRQNGNVFAPLGALSLEAGSVLQLGAASLTSTSAYGVAAPFFRTQPGGDLLVPRSSPDELNLVFVESVEIPAFERRLPEQSLSLKGPAIEIAEGARFDLRGGTDAKATEFIPGPGGSRDILLADLDSGSGVEANPSFAIVPGLNGFAPYDPLETPASESVQGIGIGDTLVLEEGLPGLPAGEYAVLPARYALFGGYLVTPLAGTQDLGAGVGMSSADGSPVVAGRFGSAGSATLSSRSQGFVIASAARVHERAEYLETPLGDLYQSSMPRSPRDAGALTIEAGSALTLGGRIVQGGDPAGRGPQVDIIADAISVLPSREAATGRGVELLVEQIERLGAESLLIGGRRSLTSDGLSVSPKAEALTVASGVRLEVPELILVADRLRVETASSGVGTTLLASSGAATDDGGVLRIDGSDGGGDAAALAVSNRRLTFDRTGSTESLTGYLSVGSGTLLRAPGAVVADVAGDADFAAAIDGRRAIVSLGASSISLGAVEGLGLTGGMILSNPRLSGIAGGDLRLRSDSVVTVYGSLPGAGASEDIDFARLAIDAQGIVGAGNADDLARLVADEIQLSNRSGGTLAASGLSPSAGGLSLSAERLILGGGDFTIQGFGDLALRAGDYVLMAGDGELSAEAPVTLNAPVISATQGVDAAIRALGADLVISGGRADALAGGSTGLGSELLLAGNNVTFGGHLLLPSGRVDLLAQQDLMIGSGAVLSAAGLTVDFGATMVGTPGGTIRLRSENGSIRVASNAELNVSPSPVEGSAGEVLINAPAGTFSVAPGARFLSGRDGGGLLLDASQLEVAGVASDAAYGQLNQLLGWDFSSRRHVRLRSQSITLGESEVVRAHEVRAVSDTGDVTIAGTIDASGRNPGSMSEDGGTIVLAAGDSVTLEPTAVLRARGASDGAGNPAPGTEGGRIDFFALDSDGSDPLGASDAVYLKSGAIIDVTGGPSGTPGTKDRVVVAPRQSGGNVLVHTRRLDVDGNGQTETLVLGDMDAQVWGAQRSELVGTQVVGIGDKVGTMTFDLDRALDSDGIFDDASITAGDIAAIKTEIDQFVQNANTTAGGFQVVPGLVLESPDGLILEDAWDFYQGWHFQKSANDPVIAGELTLRAAGDLALADDLTDSFFDQPGHRIPVLNIVLVPDYPDRVAVATQVDADGNPLPPPSWGYRLVAGADTSSADLSAAIGGIGDLWLQGRVRTGTADIEVVAGDDLTLEPGAAIYTAGHNLGLSDNVTAVLPGSGPFDTEFYFNSWLGGGAQFVTDGGDVRITAGGDVEAEAVQGLPTVWQPRIGEAFIGTGNDLANDAGAVPAHWGIAFDRFTDGIGALGGGTVELRVGGSLVDVAVAVPTTGRAIAGVEDANIPGSEKFGEALETTEVAGGGKLLVALGGDLEGGSLHLGSGLAHVQVGDRVVAGSSDALRLYAGFDAQMQVLATGDLDVGGISDPTTVNLSDTQAAYEAQKPAPDPSIIANTEAYFRSLFYTYSETAGVDLHSLASDVTLSGPGFVGQLPPVLRAVSHGRDVALAGDFSQYPSPQGQIELLAAANLTGSNSKLAQSDQDSALLPSIDKPSTSDLVSEHALVPVHIDDERPNLFVALEGSVTALDSPRWRLELAKSSIFQAGQDLSNLSVDVQNVRSRDVSLFSAGRDIVQDTVRNPITSDFDVPAEGTNKDFVTKYQIAGPGAAMFIAGRSIALGTSDGIESVGDADNRVLADEGANLLLLAGVGDGPAYDAFLETYLLNDDTYTSAGGACASWSCSSTLNAFLGTLGVEVANGDPLATFQSLNPRQQRLFVAKMLLNELKESGTDATTSGSEDYSRGFAAIETLFPNRAGDGGISLLLSQVQTLDGGDIEMLVPAGSINAGAANSDIIAKGPEDLGIVAALNGDIGIFVEGDLLVNSTRAFALQGDLLVWSSSGSIDAGKGAKTVSSIPNPIYRIGPTGESIIELPPAIEGSGLQGVNVVLFAPRGVVNAGDAGIRAAQDLTVGATAIEGADNIDIGGFAVGFSLGPPPSVAVGLTGATGVAASTSKAAENATASQVASRADESGAQAGQGMAVIDVEVVGFGDG